MYVVTGGAGFIGSVFIKKLNQEGIDEIIVVDELRDSPKWLNLIGKQFVEYVHKDQFLEHLEAGKYRGQISCVVHMGACSSTTEEDGDYLMRNNFDYSRTLCEYCLDQSVRFIYASSAAVYGDGTQGFNDDDQLTNTYKPLNRYGFSKQLFDLWCIRKKITDSVVGLRFFNVYGPNEAHKGSMRSVIHKAYYQLKKEGKISLFRSYRPEYNDGEQKRDFIYVKDCAEALWWFTNHSRTNGIFNLGTGNARSWNDVANALCKALGTPPAIEYVDMPDNLVQQYQYFTEANISILEASGCPLPSTSLEQGVEDYVKHHLETDLSF
ncbi:MAG: ADP-glyceromanno-heptose 6-epimerase [Bdellovibrionales bacterium]|nr:ADP-glyceromanno-heptose 6-epimerase [Bdellovibrionales bacterium]